jgi:hypothetical protein
LQELLAEGSLGGLMADTKRRARGEDSIFFAPSRKCWVGEITVGWKPDGRRDRITVRGKTKTEVN